jgi:hypothetical protein
MLKKKAVELVITIIKIIKFFISWCSRNIVYPVFGRPVHLNQADNVSSCLYTTAPTSYAGVTDFFLNKMFPYWHEVKLLPEIQFTWGKHLKRYKERVCGGIGMYQQCDML